ncbi:class I SAM-dependent methyltransferase [Isoalcanivorax beigongshangi]|uniref:Class I SAM-dependent methyltransferase n=1 Tax=Isoalcanivorax beigongshangi TaxID=3238810 RepID=A0ABV4AH87_9GAMM
MKTSTPIAETELVHPRATLVLQRYPRSPRERLRAWDGADLYLLDEATDQPALVLNDSCGALALALPADTVSVGDSWLARAALAANAADNQRPLPQWAWPHQDWPARAQVLVRVPKELALLEYQLWRLGQQLPAGTPVQLAWMDKHLPAGLVELARHYLDGVELLPGRRKAHGLRGQLPQQPVAECGYPLVLPVEEWGGAPLRVEAGVFAQRQIDIGARAMLPVIPTGIDGTIADLGCGAGILGIAAGLRNPQAKLLFCDESSQAIESARHNATAQLGAERVAFHLGHGLDGIDTPLDLILLNPPFHRGHAVDDAVARMLFRQAADHLAADGALWVVGNRHLAYGNVLKRHFADVEQVAGDRKFIVWRARQSRRTGNNARP